MEPRIQDGDARIPDTSRAIPAEIPALIVGGGPVGLTMSLLLSYYGVRSLLVEQHPGTSTYPKARLFKVRLMEIFRQLGIESAIRALAIPHARNLIIARTLAGEELHRRPIETVLPEFVQAWSPTSGITSTQDAVEPVLLEHAQREEPAQLRFATQLVSFEQHDDHVLARLVHRPTGRVQAVRAQYLVAADGSHSSVRQALGIPMVGRPILSEYVNILFRADLSPWVAHRELNIGILTEPDAPGLLLNNGENHWRFTAFYDPAKGQRPEDFTPARCLQVLHLAVGAPDLALELDDITPWHDGALVAERFYDRRVLLAGDAEHVMSPMGGFALNVGIEDAHNLAWKLAAVLKGWVPPALLETYQSERLPVSRRITENSARNAGSIHATADDGARPAQAHATWTRHEMSREHGLALGLSYDSSAIVPDGTPPVQVANPITDYVPNARPGSRAPHVWLQQNGRRISTLDLFGPGFVLLTGSSGHEWLAAARQSAEQLRIPLSTYSIGPAGDLISPEGPWNAAYGIDEDGAVLVRPDGYVAWRRRSGRSDAGLELDQAIGVAIGKNAHIDEALIDAP